jgi:uncharacterized protein (UPF0276 family)
MVFSAALRPFLKRRNDAIDVLEIEPQTMWLADDALQGPFFEFAPGIEAVAALPGRKLVHSVGVPLGGTRPPNDEQLRLLARTAERLNSPWVSEHLSVGGTPHRASGFFLPPLQTDEGVAVATRNILTFAEGVGRPVAVETGVAYMRRKPFEMADGAFIARVAEEAGCGILLDLHNLYCNERNGRIELDTFLAEIPLDRVWEVHLAGGDARDGFWLDSHSGAMPEDLARRALEIVQSLPNLGAVNFEIYDTFLERLDDATLDRIADGLRDIWEAAGHARSDAAPPRLHAESPAHPAPSVDAWETGLTDAVWKADPILHPWPEDDAPLRLYSDLARSFRGSMLARTLPRTMRYLLLRDRRGIDDMLSQYFCDEDPKLYAPLEAKAFAQWLRMHGQDDALLSSLLEYDLAFLRILRDGTPQVVHFPGNPAPIFEALAAARLPAPPEPPAWEMEILPDEITPGDFKGSAADS